MPTNPARADAEQALERVLSSRVFEKAERSRRFLRYLVESSLAQPGSAIKEYTIALDVFDRDVTYDPSIDATVRVEASRLRSRLREYYVEEGSGDDLVIEVPKGSYSAVLRSRKKIEISPAALLDLPSAEFKIAQLVSETELPGEAALNRSRGADAWRWIFQFALIPVLAVVAGVAAFFWVIIYLTDHGFIRTIDL